MVFLNHNLLQKFQVFLKDFFYFKLNFFNEIVEAAITSYFVTGDFLQYIYSVPVIKNHKNIR